KLNGEVESPDYRDLQINLGIALGDWNYLSEFVSNEYRERDNRSAHDLIRAAQIALNLDSPNSKELIHAAAAKGDDDATVLVAAYLFASNAGWEDSVEVGQWLHKAAELSGDDGPIQTMALKDILNLKPEWDRRESETWQLLSRGEIPMFLAAQSLNKSLIDLMLFPALANLSESDPRRRGAISASVSWLVPKPHTPMQWCAMSDEEYFHSVRERLGRLSRVRLVCRLVGAPG
ncbi:MAG: hypothetical protein IIB31_08655, partial [Chloroflexi bacterium]|nr:hypothetical protein [Chloroflexota bacterium]